MSHSWFYLKKINPTAHGLFRTETMRASVTTAHELRIQTLKIVAVS